MPRLVRYLSAAMLCVALAACSQAPEDAHAAYCDDRAAAVLRDFLAASFDAQTQEGPTLGLLWESESFDLSSDDLDRINAQAKWWDDAAERSRIPRSLWSSFVDAQTRTMRFDMLGAQLPPGVRLLNEKDFRAGYDGPTVGVYAVMSVISCPSDDAQALLVFEQVNTPHAEPFCILLELEERTWRIKGVFEVYPRPGPP